MTLTHNGITYEPPVSNKEYKRHISNKNKAAERHCFKKSFNNQVMNAIENWMVRIIATKGYYHDGYLTPKY